MISLAIARWARLCCLLSVLSLAAGCVVLPAPSTLTVEDGLKNLAPLQEGEAIVFDGASVYTPTALGFLKPYLTLGCIGDYEGQEMSKINLGLLEFSSPPGWFAVRSVREFPDARAYFKALEQSRSLRAVPAEMFASNRLRYFVHVAEETDTQAHIPLYVVPFGMAACGNRERLVARIWELPSGKLMGTVKISSRGEFLGLAYMAHLIFDPRTQKKAGEAMAEIISKKLVTGSDQTQSGGG